MNFPFNVNKDPVINQLVKYAGSESICEQAMCNAYREGIIPVPILSIIKHIRKLKS